MLRNLVLIFDRLAQYEKQCGEFSIEINRQAYISGHQYGLTLYCTYENGMRLGRQGETLNRVCERTNFQDFKKGHSTGYEVYLVTERAREEIEDAQEQARDEMEDAQEQARHDIRRAQQQARDDIERSHEETLRAMKQCTFDSDCGPNMRCDSEYKTIGSASGHVNICKSKRF